MIGPSLDTPTAGGVIHNLPYGSMGGLFKGRQDMLDRLRSELGAGKTAAITQVQAIHGLGGVGKTRLAVEYAWSALEDGLHTTAFFVVADTVANLHANLAALAGPHLLNLPEQESREQPVIVEAVLTELTQRTGWLMLIDNVDSDEAAARLHKDVLPRLAGGNVLITSRRSNWPDDVTDLAIDKLDEPDAVAYLLEKTGRKRAESTDDEELAKEIARKLGGLPVALEQAAAYICQRRIGFAAYLEDFAKSRKKVLSWHKDELNYPVAVLAAWQTTNERLGPSEQAILRLASFLAPEAIPAALFESQPEKIKEAAGLIHQETAPASQLPDEEDDPDVRGLLAELAGWSMITLEQESFTIHRLVQDSIRLSIPQDRLNAWAKLALELVNQYIPSDPPPQDVRSWDIWELAESHVEAIIAYADDLGIGEPTARLMNELAQYSQARAKFDEAEPLRRRALGIYEQSLGKDHPNVAIALNNLATLFQATNRLDEAEPLLRRALEIGEQSLGEEHPKVAIRLSNLAQLLKYTNRLAEAEPLMRRALAIDEHSLGKDHSNVAIRLNNLAGLLTATKRVDEAEPMYRRALAIDEQSFGRDHPDVAIDLNNLAQLLQATNQLAKAEPLMRRALEIDEQSLGKDHPNVARDLNNLAHLFAVTNRLAEAEPLMRRALEICEKSLGPDHPNTKKVRESLEGLK